MDNAIDDTIQTDIDAIYHIENKNMRELLRIEEAKWGIRWKERIRL